MPSHASTSNLTLKDQRLLWVADMRPNDSEKVPYDLPAADCYILLALFRAYRAHFENLSNTCILSLTTSCTCLFISVGSIITLRTSR